MPRIGITAYDLLISCPGDVVEYIDTIRECIDNFNRYIGQLNNAQIVAKHWSTDSYPQSGDKPQELLNEQFVRDCDAAIAIFWTRFGTPTDKYGSGTEEEIEEMLSANKQVFMYFLDAPVEPSKINSEQYQNVNKFKDKYKDRGIYYTINNKDDFKTLFSNHLTMHFLPLISNEKPISNITKLPDLKISGVSDGEIQDSFFTSQTNLLDSKLLKEKKSNIISTISTLNQNTLPPRDTPHEVKNNEVNNLFGSDNIQKLLKETVNTRISDADFPSTEKDIILKFIQANNITISNDFWNVGNLTKSVSLLVPIYGNSTSYGGTDAEKERYRSLENLYWDIKEYNEYLSFFSQIDAISLSELAITNKGTSFDEDIDIKLIFPKNVLMDIYELPTPEINIIEQLTELDFVEQIFKIKESAKIDSYDCYPMKQLVYSDMLPTNLLNKPSVSEKYEDNKLRYRHALEQIFCYKKFATKDNDILSFHITYLKHNTSMTFPSVLLFKQIPEYMEYEITSKHISEIIKGKITFK